MGVVVVEVAEGTGKLSGGKGKRGVRVAYHPRNLKRKVRGVLKVMLKLKEGSFQSINPLRLVGMLRDELGKVKHAQILNDGKLLVFCASATQAAAAAGLKMLGGRHVEGYVPGKKPGMKGVVYGVSLEIAMEELIEGIENVKVLGAERIKVFRDGSRRDSTVVVINFREEVLPERVYLGCLSFKVHPHRRPPLRCFKCQRYGHMAAACRGERRCGKCGDDHEFSACKVSALKCGTCGGGHVAGSRDCEHFKRAAKVQQYKEDRGVSYAEAVKQVSSQNVSSATVRREGSIPQVTAAVPEDSVVIKRVNFLAFIVEVISGAKQCKNNSDVVRCVVEAADRAHIGGVEPATLHGMVFAKRVTRPIGGGCPENGDDV